MNTTGGHAESFISLSTPTRKQQLMKTLLFILLFLSATFSFAQTTTIPENIKSAFEGSWQYTTQYQSNTVVIQFEPGKNYALFTDIGSGKAPARNFQATVKDKVLVIPGQPGQNDYIEMEVIKGKLYLSTQLVSRDEKGNILRTGSIEKRVFNRMKKGK